MTLEPEAQEARGEIVRTARDMLSGALSFIEGARLICQLRSRAKLADLDPDILPFLGIYSETDALPIGDVRRLWAPEALARMQPEIDRLEQWARNFGTPKCQTLIDRFSAKGD